MIFPHIEVKKEVNKEVNQNGFFEMAHKDNLFYINGLPFSREPIIDVPTKSNTVNYLGIDRYS